MRFWDSSAVVALLVDEPQHRRSLAELKDDDAMLVWWATPVECVSALARHVREDLMSADDFAAANGRLQVLAEQWHEVLPTNAVRSVAERMLRVHVLRAADALQLAAATIAAERDPPTLELVSLDERLNAAALKEGFRIA